MGNIETSHAAYIDWEDFLQNMRFEESQLDDQITIAQANSWLESIAQSDHQDTVEVYSDKD